jgi:hypothetical protein
LEAFHSYFDKNGAQTPKESATATTVKPQSSIRLLVRRRLTTHSFWTFAARAATVSQPCLRDSSSCDRALIKALAPPTLTDLLLVSTSMVTQESNGAMPMGRGAYGKLAGKVEACKAPTDSQADTTGVPKPKPPPPKRR